MAPPYRAAVSINRDKAFKWLIVVTNAEEAPNKHSLSP